MSEVAKQADQAAKHERKKPRTPEEIQADIAASRDNLTQTLGDLQHAVKEATKPKNIAKKAAEKVKSVYVAPNGEVNVKNVGITAGVVVTYILWRRVTRRRR